MHSINPTSKTFCTRNVEECTNRETSIGKHAQMVRIVARRLQSRLPACVSHDDLVSAGMIGLIQAVDRFQSDRGLPFKSFAQHRILGAMLDYLRAEDPLSRRARQRFRETCTDGYTLTVSLESFPTELFLRSPAQPDSQTSPIIDRIDIRRAKMYLSSRENRVISLLYEYGWKNRDIALQLKVNESRVSQIKHAALSKLRDYFRQSEQGKAA